ncbi:TrbI/VirB10 family protein [Moellerella wisconsensis]|uniref:TrbI/VirB10 family protein n=1 Tax=Moellerella wisconsensis TaxID=158849 RepID=UPI00240F5099|nr:TrbI/VirB10 family protein [Moellerella wisconsensis]
MSKIKERWETLDAKKKRLFVWGGTLVVLIPSILMLMPESRKPASRGPSEQIISSVLTDSDTQGVSQNAIAARLRALGESIEKQNTNITDLKKSLNVEEINKRLITIEQQQRSDRIEQEKLKKRVESAATVMPYTKSVRSIDIYNGGKDAKQGVEKLTPDSVHDELNNNDTLQRVYENSQQPNPADFGLDTDAKGKDGKKVAPATPDIVSVHEDIKEVAAADPDDDPSFQTYLPATSILSGVFISGMDAPTSQNARKDPYPALIRIKKDAILPNRFRADVRECGMLAAGFGELSSERGYFRSEVITCIRDDGAVFESPIDAYAVGEDGKAGVRGRLVTKQGQYLAKALTVGFLQAASSLFSVQSIPTINVTRDNNSSKKNNTPYEQVMSSEALQGAAIAGVGGALDRLADFYMNMAGDLFPVIEIDPGRSVDFIVQKGVTLKFTRVKPNGKATPTTFNSNGAN